jgi:hypothetical protein
MSDDPHLWLLKSTSIKNGAKGGLTGDLPPCGAKPSKGRFMGALPPCVKEKINITSFICYYLPKAPVNPLTGFCSTRGQSPLLLHFL